MFERQTQRKRNECVQIEGLESRRLFATIISGTVFREMDSDGLREAGEKGLAGQRVFVDTNLDGKWQRDTEASTLTDSNGFYSFTAELPGLYRISLIVPRNHRPTVREVPYHDIHATGDDFHVANDFGVTTTIVVKGNVFNDANGDGIKQEGEQGIGGVRVYIDKNNNGVRDRREKTRITDSNGDWRFGNLLAGKYRIRVNPANDDAIVTSPGRGFLILKLKKGQTWSNRMIGLTD